MAGILRSRGESPVPPPPEEGRPAPAGLATIVVCTRNRPYDLQRALDAALAHAPGVPILVIDQGDEPALGIPEGVEVHRDDGRGASRARNIALQLVTTPLVVFVDDDCAIHPHAVERLVEALTAHPHAALAFGTVAATQVPEGFIPTYYPPKQQVLHGRSGKLADGGIGALMAVRRQQALEVGGFDVRLGAGVELAACEDGEFAYRLLGRGHAILHVPDAVVEHYGMRRWSEARRYAYQTYRGIGAAYALHMRQADPWAAALLLQQFGLVAREMLSRALRGQMPGGLAKVAGLLAGISTGLRMRPLVPEGET